MGAYLFRRERPKPIGVFQRTQRPQAVAWAPTGDMIVTSGRDNRIILWNPWSRQTLVAYRGFENIVRLAWSPNGIYLAGVSSEGWAQVWHAESGKEVARYIGHIADAPGSKMYLFDLAWSPDGQYIATGDGGFDTSSAMQLPTYQLHVWSALTGRQLARYEGHTEQIHGVAWSPDGAHIATGSWDATIRIWQAPV